MKKTILTVSGCLILLFCISGPLAAQNPDIDMYINSWKNSFPRSSHGSLIERDILTPGDSFNPTKPGAVLEFARKFARGVLEGYARTEPVSYQGQEEILYITKGKGRIESGSKTAELVEGIGVLVPPDVEYTLINETAEDLEMLILRGDYMAEKAPPKEIVVKDSRVLPIHAGGHWTHIVRELFKADDGLGGFFAILLVSIDGMNIAEPHPHGPGDEEIWYALKGKSLLWLGREIRWQEEGTAFMIPKTGKTTHANININDEPIMLFYFRTFPELSKRSGQW